MNPKMADKLTDVMAAATGTPLEPLRDVLVVASGRVYDLQYRLQGWGRHDPALHPVSRMIAIGVGDPFERWDMSDLPTLRAEFDQINSYLPRRIRCVTQDLPIEFNGIKVNARRFLPPVVKVHKKVIFLHGGGFVLGSYTSNDPECDRIACELGCEVISLGYPLSPENNYPTALNVVTSAITRNGLVSGAPYVIMGESAGGNLALAALQNNKRVAENCIGLVLIYPYLDLTLSGKSAEEFGEGYFLTKGLLQWFAECYVGESSDVQDSRISPLFGDMNGIPPALAIVGEFDPLVSDATRFAELHPGTRVEIFSGMLHGFLQLRGLSTTREKALKAIAEFIQGL